MSISFDSIRSAATGHAACPICLDSLASRPDEVGALTFSGRRVEAALYHQSCVGIRAAGGLPRLPGDRSPITRSPVDGFLRMPPLSERSRWLNFVDWDNDGRISVAEVASALAGMLPVREDAVERLLRERFSVSGDFFSRPDLESDVIPYIASHAGDLAAAAPRTAAPTLLQASSRPELLAWFRYWDQDGSGSLDADELRYAVATLFFQALGDADFNTKHSVVEAFLDEAGLTGNVAMTKSIFVDQFAPVLQANLPHAPAPTMIAGQTPHRGAQGPADFRLRLLLTTTAMSEDAVLPTTASFGDLRREALRRFGSEAAAVDLFLAGRRLDCADDDSLSSIAELQRAGAVVQVLPRSLSEETARVQRLREEVALEREMIRREREELQRRQASTSADASTAESTRKSGGSCLESLMKSFRSARSLFYIYCARIQLFCSNLDWWFVAIAAAAAFYFVWTNFLTGSNTDHPSSGTSRGTSKVTGQDEGQYSRQQNEQHQYNRGDYDYTYSYDSSGGILAGLDPTAVFLVITGFGYACWSGIIPIQNMHFWQGIMLWNFVQPLLYGGRRARGAGSEWYYGWF